jgi:hypothetical protein
MFITISARIGQQGTSEIDLLGVRTSPMAGEVLMGRGQKSSPEELPISSHTGQC